MTNKLFSFDKSKIKKYSCLIGTDEAGRGPGAGPVFSAAVCFTNIDRNLIRTLSGINDSKKLSERTREEFFILIQENSIFHISSASVEEIEKLNILQASLLSMKRACDEVMKKLDARNFRYSGNFESTLKVEQQSGSEELSTCCDTRLYNNIKILIDGNKLIPKYQFDQEYIIKGDSKSASIAAASILAKVSRDRFMKELSREFPQYKWDKNKGYLTQEHLLAIDEFGTTQWHRKKFLEKHFNKCEQVSLPLLLQ